MLIWCRRKTRIALARIWGGGEVASADGMRFVVPVRTIHAGTNPKYYGIGRGVTWYNMISDQFTGLNGIPVPGTLRDSLVLLAVLLEQQTELQPTQNRGEGRHALARAVFHGKRGELRQRYQEGQEDQLGALGLVVNMIVLWNTIYIEAVLDQLRKEGWPVKDEDIAHLLTIKRHEKVEDAAIYITKFASYKRLYNTKAYLHFLFRYSPNPTYQGSWRAPIEGVRIDSAIRSRGIGAKMFEWAIARARERGCKLVQLASNKSRHEARRFYEELGFVASHEGMKLRL
jgi:GNAT superfamily N-acetyltransferase